MTDRTEVKLLVDQFFKALLNDDVSELPLANDVELTGALQPAPIRGEVDVRDHLVQIAPFMRRVHYSRLIIEDNSAAAVTEFVAVNGVNSKGAYFFEVKDGKIQLIESVFDTRPFFTGNKS
jgi:hypothetical protein